MEIDNQKLKASLDYFKGVTGKISPASPESVEEIGKRIRIIRTEKGLSLDQLSNLTGFEVEILSDIESNKFQPQLGTLISHAL